MILLIKCRKKKKNVTQFRSGNSPLGPRTSHGSIFDEVDDALYIYGGFDLNSVKRDLMKYELKEIFDSFSYIFLIII